MKVTKRDGRMVQFDKNKIVSAISAAFQSTKNIDGLEDAQKIADSIESLNKDLSVEEIQDIIEKKLMASSHKDVAKEYILYRNNRNLERTKKSRLTKNITKRIKAADVENQNANVDEKSFGGRMGAVTSDVMKEYALNNCMSKKSRDNHLNNEIYIHDLDHYAIGDHNCLSVPFDDLLAKGFNTRQTDVRPANSINTAFQLIAVIFQLQSLQQFGGVSATHLDWTMIPYVRKSFWKHFKDGLHYIQGEEIPSDNCFDENLCIDSDIYKVANDAYEYAINMTERELKQAVEGMYHNLNY